MSPSPVVYENRLHKEERLWRPNPAEGGVFGLAQFFEDSYLLQHPSVLFSFYSSIDGDLLTLPS